MFPYPLNICNQPPIMYYFVIPNSLFANYFTTYQHQTPSPHTNINQDHLTQPSLLLTPQFQSDLCTPSKHQSKSEVYSQAQNYESQLKDVRSRNILPNAINLILSFIRRVNKSGKIVSRMIKKLGGSRYSLKKYYSYQSYLKEAITNYTSKNILHLVISFCDPSCKIFQVEEQKFYNMVTRNLVLHFIQEDGLLALFTSKKQHKTLKTDHLKVYRFIINDLKRACRRKMQQE